MTKCATVSLGEAAHVLGIHRSTAWSLNQRGEFPVPVLRIGSSLRVVKTHLETYLTTGVPVELEMHTPSTQNTSLGLES